MSKYVAMLPPDAIHDIFVAGEKVAEEFLPVEVPDERLTQAKAWRDQHRTGWKICLVIDETKEAEPSRTDDVMSIKPRNHGLAVLVDGEIIHLGP